VTALKILVACVSIATFGLLVAVSYKHDETAGYLCAAVGVIGALAAFSIRFARAMEPLAKWFVGTPLPLLISLPAWLPYILPEEVGEPVRMVGIGLLWGLLTAWINYKVVQTLRGPLPAAA